LGFVLWPRADGVRTFVKGMGKRASKSQKETLGNDCIIAGMGLLLPLSGPDSSGFFLGRRSLITTWRVANFAGASPLG